TTMTTVMVVDDEADSREMYAVFLSKAGMCVRQAASMAEAWHLIRQELPRIVVTDLAMPGFDGFELCRRIRQERSSHETTIIALIGLTLKPAEIQRLIDAGSDRLLLKPCLPATLLGEIREALAQTTAIRAQAQAQRVRARMLTERAIQLQEWTARL